MQLCLRLDDRVPPGMQSMSSNPKPEAMEMRSVGEFN